MNRTELKNILKKQAASYSSDLQHKISALYSGENFLTNVSVYDSSEVQSQEDAGDDWETLLSGSVEKKTAPETVVAPQAPVTNDENEIASMIQNRLKKDKIVAAAQERSRKEEIDAARKRIALLRGVSLPGEYLGHKKK